MKWAYGVTTVPARRKTLLPSTLASLAGGGFDKPRLFVDGDKDVASWEREFRLEVTCRYPAIRTFGNWALTLAELYIREPAAERYAVFQDDFVTYRNLRQYLEKVPYPAKGYLNLYTFPKSQDSFPRLGQTARFRSGFFQSNQRGWGAVALVFSREAVNVLLTHQHMVERPMDAIKGWRNVDGGIVTAFKKAGWKEYVHNPSLVQHTGHVSSMRSRKHPEATSFLGEAYDALEILNNEGYPASC